MILNYTNNKSNQTFSIYILLLILLSSFLNQTYIVFGINSSIADTFLIFGLLYHLASNNIQIPKPHLIYFLLLSTSILVIATFYTGYKFSVNINHYSIIKDYTKIIIVFLYFTLGFNVNKNEYIYIALKYFSYTAVFIGLIGIITNMLNINTGLFYMESRFKGLINDPNYFSVIQVAALPYFFSNSSIKYKIVPILIIIYSILLSGSKTGFVVLLLYLMVFLLLNEKVVWWKKVFIFIFLPLFLYLYSQTILSIMNNIAAIIPVAERLNLFIQDLLSSNVNNALNDGGSSRGGTWEIALKIISMVPLTGIGVGTYTKVAEDISGIGVLAHNTYLQLFSEWGIIFATIFFIYIFCVIFSPLTTRNSNSLKFIVASIILILLLGSFSISINNARMFWFFLGILASIRNTSLRSKQ
ncbi:hypothetical protein F7731_09320 [Cytobacillus depressus]|uniref:O-antigen ligase-related domain-containing protein n=1 Tax=Cytobacillus depressus TaxID=1602942 RepID=A0A6L3VBH5_9BACI|nr:O-antigen ligase family protein [Cytobacillus depressus]KAB2336563.1 hypothetical protein F7731_09320 [Cytobacillus depressus]